MLDNFPSDLEKGKTAEAIVLNTFSMLTSDYKFVDVSNDVEYYYKGDIKAIAPSGKELYIEVKNDSRIGDTKNILCEDEVYYKESDYYAKGNMHNESDYYCIVSEPERKIYVLDFKKLQSIYRKGQYKEFNHPQQKTYGFLLELCRAIQWKALLYRITY